MKAEQVDQALHQKFVTEGARLVFFGNERERVVFGGYGAIEMNNIFCQISAQQAEFGHGGGKHRPIVNHKVMENLPCQRRSQIERFAKECVVVFKCKFQSKHLGAERQGEGTGLAGVYAAVTVESVAGVHTMSVNYPPKTDDASDDDGDRCHRGLRP